MKVKGGGGEPPDDSENMSVQGRTTTPAPQGEPTSPYPKELQDQFRLVNEGKEEGGLDQPSRELMMQALRSLMNPEIPVPQPKEKQQPKSLQRPSQQPREQQLPIGKGVETETRTKRPLPETKGHAHEKSPQEGKLRLHPSKTESGEQAAKAIEQEALAQGMGPDTGTREPVHDKGEQEGEFTIRPSKKEIGDATAAAAAAVQQAAGAQIAMGGTGLEDLGSGSIEQMTGSQMGSQIDKIIRAFQENQFYSASLSSVQLAMSTSGETRVTVSLTNGIEVELDLAGGGKELNIKIRGLTPDQQARLDRPEEHARLRQALLEKGFIVHQITTERGDQLTPQGRQEIPQALGSLMGETGPEKESREGGKDQKEEREQREPPEEAEGE